MLRECGVATALATAAFAFVLVAGNIVQQVIGAVSAGRVDGWQALELVGMLIPTVLPYALPMGVLTGVLMTFGRMGADGEVTAMKSAGLSLWRIASPVWIATAALALFSCWLNLEAGPASEDAFERILVGAAGGNPAALIIPGKLNRQFKGLLIRTEGKERGMLKGFRLWQVDERGRVRQALFAETARLTVIADGEGRPILRVQLLRARLSVRDGQADMDLHPGSYTTADEAVLDFPREEPGAGAYVKRLRMMTAGELVGAMDKGWQLPPSAPAAEKEKEVTRLKVQLMFRIATALSVFSLSMLAVPLAVTVSRSEANVNAAMALGVALGYYLMTSMATWVKLPSWHPEALVIVPNLAVIALACWLMVRLGRS